MATASGPVLPNAFVRELTGARDADRAKFTDQVLAALAKISPSLVPTLASHPYSDAIRDGVPALPALVQLLGKAKDDDQRAAIIDAMAEIFERENATRPAIEAITALMSSSKSEAVVTQAARALAVAHDPGFLDQQHNFLASQSLSDVRRAALLLGHGRYEPAVPLLLELLRDDMMAVSDVVIWALGEIGDPSALPKLHRMLHGHMRATHVIEAIGKIGDATSAVRLLPVLLEGAQEQRERAAQAMAQIARQNDGHLLDEELEKSVRLALERMIDQDDSKLARFHAIVAFSLLGGAMDPKRILAALGGQLAEKDLDAMSQVLMNKKAPAKPKPQPPTKGKKPV